MAPLSVIPPVLAPASVVTPLPSVIFKSSTETVATFIVTVSPDTVRLPPTETSPEVLTTEAANVPVEGV